MNIAQVCSSTSWGGLEIHVGIMIEQLTIRGHHVFICCPRFSPLHKAIQENSGLFYHYDPMNYFAFIEIVRFKWFLTKNKIDIIHVHYSKDLWTVIPAIRWFKKLKIPVVFIKHIGTQKPKRDPLHRWIYKHVCHTIAISNIIADNLKATHPIPLEKISVVHHGVDLDAFHKAQEARSSMRRDLGVADTDILIGTIGRLQEGKGHLEFLEMADRIHKAFSHTKFIIIGEPTRGEEYRAEKIFTKIEQLDLGKDLLMVGFRSDIPELLSAMDIFAFPSRAEAFGLVVIEAMAAGLSVVSTRSDGILDIVQDGKTGLLVPPRDVDGLVNAVQSLIINPALKDKFSQAGKTTIAKKFSITHMMDQVINIYKNCLYYQKY